MLSLDLFKGGDELNNTVQSGEDVEEIERLIAERAAAKKERNFSKADEIRDTLSKMGITIKDTREGTVWSRNGL